MAVKHRCVRCNKKLRDDETCQNPKCVLYADESETTNISADSSANTDKINK